MLENSRSRALLSRQSSRLLVVDVQTKLIRIMPDAASVTDACRRLLAAARILEIPVHATEQYPKGLGTTVEQLQGFDEPPASKMRFSAVPSLEWMKDRSRGGRHQVVVAGIEAHVCILQTVLDLIALGFDVHVPADAVTSRKAIDRDIALRRLSAEGATITTWESVLFEWCETAEAAEFKSISRLVVEPATPSE